MNRLLITGFAYSGSTLLSLGLSRSKEVCALGEVPLVHIRSPELPCTCGVPFGKCPVWGPIFATQGEGTASLARVFDVLPALLREHEPGVRWYVDSGKTQHGGLSAHLEHREGELRVLHLVRHPAAVVYSCLVRGMTLDESIELWLEQEASAHAAFERAGLRVRTLRFEDMVADFAGTLSELGRWLGVAGPFGETAAAWDWERCAWDERAHVMASNSTVKWGGKPPSVGSDERYRHALPKRVIADIERRAAPLMERVGAFARLEAAS